MADGVFHLAAKLGEAEFVAVWNEQRIVAEAALASEYGRPFPYANAVMIAQFGGLPK